MGKGTAPRRAPAPEARQRDAERSRQLLLAAAVDEFSAKGFAGARVQDIADRAGVNKQLIAYYFGGKEGLYRALHEAWLEQEAGFAGPDVPFDTLVSEYLRASLADPRGIRLMLWDALTNGSQDLPAGDQAGQADVADIRRRQDAGEIASDLDPVMFLLAIMGAITAPLTLPQVARRMGVDPSSPEFETRYAEELKRLIRHLTGPDRRS
ncbi:TetR/AcrR family transcriptional regulator [Natronosporangium hydrolyticum]|uniref:TetR/AcrR family transcriptional regulator n=1 Tax=Natronosporangium hydrolyticum TaxID=2811111 RepID=A0A895YGU0_9ACTN|nr:TetR family transcriptional regulator [Natronosporangium hydrolyticum]QSB13746.1 TetR/AcrR family transcriptional regulator [Natronosporangium hydrolyticum]